MATRRAIANGNWSATGTWNGGVVPTNGDTVYANGFNVTLDVDVNIGGDNNPIVNTGSLVSGQWYEIVNVGGQNWTTLGAASNASGTVFQSSGTGTAGNLGTARALATLTTATNTPAGATNGGGVFTMSSVRSVNIDSRAGTTTCVNITATTGTAVFSNCRFFGGSISGAHAVNNTSASTLELAGVTCNGGSFSLATGVTNSGNGNVNVTAASFFNAGGSGNAFSVNNIGSGNININSASSISGSNNGNCINNSSATGAINITASCTINGGFGGTAGSVALQNSNTGSINISAPCNFNPGNVAAGSFALSNLSSGTVIVTKGTFTANAFTNAVNIANASADVRLSGDFLDHWSGWKAISGSKWRLGTSPTLGQTRYALAGTTDSYFPMFSSDFGAFGNPIAANVRTGVSYGGGSLTGTCAVPAAGSVALGVPIDATTGTAVLDPAAVASAVWGAVSRTITGGTVDTLTNPPTVPTVVQIRQEMDSNSTKLANLDATISSRSTLTTGDLPSVPSAASVASAVRTELTEISNLDASISSRLASASYTAPANSDISAIKSKTDNLPASPAAVSDIPTTAQIATAVEGSLLNEADGQAVLNAIVSAIGNTNLSEVSLVAAVRADLERNGGKIDSIPTTAAPTAAQNATAVWAASTKEITGGTVTTLTNSPDVPTEAEIASQVRTELSVELGRIDAAISSRLAPSGTLATVTTLTNAPTVPTAAAIADEVRVELATELARLDAPGIGATAPSAATVATAVRSELSVELARVDQAVSTRLAGSAYTAPANSDVAAIKVKTDALNTERLANVATTAIVGNLLAQSNS